MVLTLSYLWLPFMILPVYAGFERLPDSLLDASADLGARPGRTFRSVVLPSIFPSVVAGSIFTFSLSLGDYITVDIVGGTTQMLGNVVYDNQVLRPAVRRGHGLRHGRRSWSSTCGWCGVPVPWRTSDDVMSTGTGHAGLLRGVVALTLAFIYVPLLVVVINAFNPDRVSTWPPSGFTLDWWRKALTNQGARDAVLVSVQVGPRAPPLLALVLGTPGLVRAAALRLLRP